jgi:hypothetical protein
MTTKNNNEMLTLMAETVLEAHFDEKLTLAEGLEYAKKHFGYHVTPRDYIRIVNEHQRTLDDLVNLTLLDF